MEMTEFPLQVGSDAGIQLEPSARGFLLKAFDDPIKNCSISWSSRSSEYEQLDCCQEKPDFAWDHTIIPGPGKTGIWDVEQGNVAGYQPRYVELFVPILACSCRLDAIFLSAIFRRVLSVANNMLRA